MRLERVELCVDGPLELAPLRREFPAIAIARVDAAGPRALTEAAWRDEALDFWVFDRVLDDIAARGEALCLCARASEARAIATEVLIRAQRLAPRKTLTEPWFERLLAHHRALHDLDKPLVRADLDHALDTWQWTLRLDPAAPATVQLAALLHDIERLTSEADARIEHHAPDGHVFKDQHALAGAHAAHTMLARAGVPATLAAATVALIARHERPGDAPAVRALDDADALSFFSLNSPGYLAYFGPAQTARKIAYTLARMSPHARGQLASVRLPRFVREELERLQGGPRRA